MDKIISGAMNPLDNNAIKHAYIMYENIRKQSLDIIYIAKNTNFNLEQLSLIKGHIFYNRHYLSNGKVDRFDPSYEMAESWRRLSNKKGKGILKHDTLMLHHELLEIELIAKGYSQQDAHHMASDKYDYANESSKYYRSLGYNI